MNFRCWVFLQIGNIITVSGIHLATLGIKIYEYGWSFAPPPYNDKQWRKENGGQE